jgi:hypothetical protein
VGSASLARWLDLAAHGIKPVQVGSSGDQAGQWQLLENLHPWKGTGTGQCSPTEVHLSSLLISSLLIFHWPNKVTWPGSKSMG